MYRWLRDIHRPRGFLLFQFLLLCRDKDAFAQQFCAETTCIPGFPAGTTYHAVHPQPLSSPRLCLSEAVLPRGAWSCSCKLRGGASLSLLSTFSACRLLLTAWAPFTPIQSPWHPLGGLVLLPINSPRAPSASRGLVCLPGSDCRADPAAPWRASASPTRTPHFAFAVGANYAFQDLVLVRPPAQSSNTGLGCSPSLREDVDRISRLAVSLPESLVPPAPPVDRPVRTQSQEDLRSSLLQQSLNHDLTRPLENADDLPVPPLHNVPEVGQPTPPPSKGCATRWRLSVKLRSCGSL